MQISDDKTTPVAVKILKCDASRETKDDFRREVKIMSSFEHGNILQLLGIVPTGEYYTSESDRHEQVWGCLERVFHVVSSLRIHEWYSPGGHSHICALKTPLFVLTRA